MVCHVCKNLDDDGGPNDRDNGRDRDDDHQFLPPAAQNVAPNDGGENADHLGDAPNDNLGEAAVVAVVAGLQPEDVINNDNEGEKHCQESATGTEQSTLDTEFIKYQGKDTYGVSKLTCIMCVYNSGEECTETSETSDYVDKLVLGEHKWFLSNSSEEGPIQESSAHIKDSITVVVFGNYLFKTKVRFQF